MTNEIRRNAAKSLHDLNSAKNGDFQELRFEGFKLRTIYPDNVCVMQDGTVLVCSKFKEIGEFSFVIYGHRFSVVESAYKNENSFNVGLRKVEGLSKVVESFPAKFVENKCVTLPYGYPIDSDLIGQRIDMNSWNKWFTATLV